MRVTNKSLRDPIHQPREGGGALIGNSDFTDKALTPEEGSVSLKYRLGEGYFFQAPIQIGFRKSQKSL